MLVPFFFLLPFIFSFVACNHVTVIYAMLQILYSKEILSWNKWFLLCWLNNFFSYKWYPDQPYHFFTSTIADSTKFLTYLWTYNNKFAFTSFGVRFDRNLCQRNRTIYTFQAQGQIYQYINDLVPLDEHPSYLQLYFYDTEHELENHIPNSTRLDSSIIAQLMYILHFNPYSMFFRSLGDLPNLEKSKDPYKISLDQRVFNSLTKRHCCF